MPHSRHLVALVGVLALAFAAAAGLAAAAGVSWGTAVEARGTAALNLGGDAQLKSVSCPSARNCVAGGFYHDGSNKGQAFVASEKSGVWANAVKVPGTAALNVGGDAAVNSVSCATAGNCTAGGVYTDGSFSEQAFVVSKKNGVWGTAIEVPGTAALDVGGQAQVYSVSCASAGNCAAGGSYTDGSFHLQVFVASQKNGIWHAAVEVPGTAALNLGSFAFLESVSCASAGNCAAGGYYSDGSGGLQAFVVNEKNGVWGTALEVPGTAALNFGQALVYSVSCANAGNCSAGGDYRDRSVPARFQAFVVSEKNGIWGNAVKVPGTAGLNLLGKAAVKSVSCKSAGNCTAGGYYHDNLGRAQAFVVTEKNGIWGASINVPGIASLNLGNDAAVNSVSCASPGNCGAGGYYKDGASKYQAFVVGQKNRVWLHAVKVPGTTPTLNVGGNAAANSVSCALIPMSTLGRCAVGGYYADGSGKVQAFITAP
jgi:hypothetical protein